ncbi:MAG: PQQ-dependent sugar dehydrogenase, partial [Tepidisphaeraceae bacterium]
IMTVGQPYANHNGGLCLFGPDGMMYIGMGDGGSAGDPQNRAQNPAELLGKMLRIDVNRRNGYAVPSDNPLVGRRGACPEIWAGGLRNPWRFCFDPVTGLLYCADVGQYLWEEIDIITRGGNYGWRIREGAHPFRPVDNPPGDLVDPIKEYGHELGISITGGYVYRGRRIPSLVGWYVYGDYSSGRIWALKYENGKVTGDVELLNTRALISSFGEDSEGELYVCDHAGSVLKIVPGP